jgi:hypothetical protein
MPFAMFVAASMVIAVARKWRSRSATVKLPAAELLDFNVDMLRRRVQEETETGDR